MKANKCNAKTCGLEFQPSQTTQKVCSMRCAINYTREQKEKAELRENRKRKQALKPRSAYLKDAQVAFNTFIRTRDAMRACISCGASVEQKRGGTYDAGHFFSIGAHPALRFDERNCHKQCVKCNRDLSGNIHNYRANLILKMGRSTFLEFESYAYQAQAKKYSIDDLKEIIKTYRAKTKEAQKLDGQKWIDTGEI